VGEALLGKKISLPTPSGGEVTLNIPQRSQNGRKLRLKGKGAPNRKGGPAGDLYVVLDVRLPTADAREIDELVRSLDGYYRDEVERPSRL
jgi:DnaJ-class molecular chaperone